MQRVVFGGAFPRSLFRPRSLAELFAQADELHSLTHGSDRVTSSLLSKSRSVVAYEGLEQKTFSHAQQLYTQFRNKEGMCIGDAFRPAVLTDKNVLHITNAQLLLGLWRDAPGEFLLYMASALEVGDVSLPYATTSVEFQVDGKCVRLEEAYTKQALGPRARYDRIQIKRNV